MRDRRFVAVHRGGPLDRESHALLARWAADCAELVLPWFEAAHGGDTRPRVALQVGRAWASGDVATGAAMQASLAAHAAARVATDPAAVAAARAAGQAVATAHAADHCMGALLYALKVLRISGLPVESELEHRISMLPEHLVDPVATGIDQRFGLVGIGKRPGG